MTVAEVEAPRRRRQGGPKVRTGCQTCKIRRVKCDETKPSCRKCASTGRKCDGYRQDLKISSSSSSDRLATVQRALVSVSGSTQERRGFQFFLSNTASELTSYYDPSFWEQLILQASVAEPSLRHAVIAIGALHESFTQNPLGYATAFSPPRSSTYDFATHQYTKAIGHLRRSLASGKQAPLTALMSCVLFVCFESLRGHFDSGMLHLKSGLRILRDYRSRFHDDQMIEEKIAPLFMRLSMQAILYVDSRQPPERQSFAFEVIKTSGRDVPLPAEFKALEEARLGMNRVVEGLFMSFYLVERGAPMAYQSEEMFRLHETYVKDLVLWNTAFEALMNNRSRFFSSKELRGAVLLKIHYTCSNIMASANPDITDLRTAPEAINAPGVFTKYTPDFQIIINLSRSLLNAAEADIKSGKPPFTFSADLGVIGPLCYTCVKSTVMRQRKEALELINRFPRREGMWDSSVCEKLITDFLEIEKKHKQMQEGDMDENEVLLPLNAMVDLELADGLRWQWKWRETSTVTTPSSGVGDSSDWASTSSSGIGSWESTLADMDSPSMDWMRDWGDDVPF